MPRYKEETHKKIISAAKMEFLKMGFEQASMRNIASQIDMSAAGLYRHFKDKEDLFAGVIQPALDATEEWYQKQVEKDYQLLEQNKLEVMWNSDTNIRFVKEVIYPHFDEFKLLLCASEGTRYSDFIHEIVLLEQKETEVFMEKAIKLGIQIGEIEQEELHLLMSAYVTALFEIVIHDFSLDDALHYMLTLQNFFTPGWRAILGF